MTALSKIKGLFVIAIIFGFIVNAHSWSIFDGIYKKTDEIKQQTNDTHVEVSAVKNATVQAIGRLEKLEARVEANAQAQASAIAGFNNKVNSVANTAGRDNNSTISNDSQIFIQYIKAQEKLSKTYEKMIIVLIAQLCALLSLNIKKDWDMNKMLVKLISDEAKRDEKSHNKRG